MEPDFSGWATKANLKCSDGRTIMKDAFKHQDKVTVPLVWHHKGDQEPENVLGHAVLTNKEEGVWADAFFNETPKALHAKALVDHKDIKFLSIFANDLVEKSKQVFHGFIREVSLVLAGANPGATIESVSIRHADGEVEELDGSAIIYTGEAIEHADAGDDGPTVKDVYDSMSEEQKNVVEFMVAEALKAKGTAEHSATSDGDKSDDKDDSEDDKSDDQSGSEDDKSDDKEDSLNHQEGNDMSRNVFETGATGSQTAERPKLTHDQLNTIMQDAKKPGMTLKESFLQHAVEYGIENIDFLFPDAKTIADSPEFVSRRMEWVTAVINGARKVPFSRIKSMSADITHDEARAKGYVKGNLKKEEWFALAKRETTPQTIYKKQKLDRDDIIDITDLDVVAWLKAEMRVMLDEELARAALVGDGREVDDEDKIDETHIRPIAFDDDFYTEKVSVPANVTGDALIEAILRARPAYRGAGNPTMFCTEAVLTDLILVKDKMNRRLYPTQAELESALRVSKIVTVPVLEGASTDDGEIQAILVNMSDYTFGSTAGGQVSMFDDFDIDYNQYKYLIEGRCSGALTKFKTAMVVTRTGGTEATPAVPTFNAATGVVTIPTVTGVVYKDGDTGATLTAGAQTALDPGETTEVEATPADGYHFPHNFDADWEFTRDA